VKFEIVPATPRAQDSQQQFNIVWWAASAKTQIARVLFYT
jgi:hypothetical protein